MLFYKGLFIKVTFNEFSNNQIIEEDEKKKNLLFQMILYEVSKTFSS